MYQVEPAARAFNLSYPRSSYSNGTHVEPAVTAFNANCPHVEPAVTAFNASCPRVEPAVRAFNVSCPHADSAAIGKRGELSGRAPES